MARIVRKVKKGAKRLKRRVKLSATLGMKKMRKAKAGIKRRTTVGRKKLRRTVRRVAPAERAWHR